MSNQRYLVAARKYRPQRFEDLVAQEHVSETLKNAIRLDRLAHAYLFSGPRGVGKTTAARILAKAINCTTAPEERTDRSEPCRQCASCRSFEEGRSLNIIEIDAASNNKVEDIRDLRETVRIPPQGSKKKVYIIDEVHMLSNAAFNALLKTLEEPPPYALFIFATTEPHKVLPTILSRCQRFDFRRIPVPDIVSRLAFITEEEHITADEASLLLIARKGDGALRDALSAFDQAVSLCGTTLQYAELAQALGVVDVDLFFEVTTYVEAGNSPGVFELVDRIVRAGYDLQEFLVGLAEHLRNILVAHTMPNTDLIEATTTVRTRYAEAGQRFSEPDLLRLLMLVSDMETALKESTQPRLKLELGLLKMTTLPKSMALREVLHKLNSLEQLAKDGKLPAALPAASLPAPQSTISTSAAPPKVSEPLPSKPAPQPTKQPATDASKQKTASASAPPSHPTTASAHVPAAAKPLVPDASAPEAEMESDAKTPATAKAKTPAPAADAAFPPAPPISAYDADEEDRGPDDADFEAPSTEPPSPQPSAPKHTPQPAVPPEQTPAASSAPTLPNLFGPPALKKRSPRNALSSGDGASGDGAPTALFAKAEVLTAAPSAIAPPAPLRAIEQRWSRCVQTVKRERIHVGSMLQHAKPVGLQAETLQIGVPDTFHQRLLNNQSDFLLKHLVEVCAQPIQQLQFVIQAAPKDEKAGEPEVKYDPRAYLLQKREEYPVLQAIFEQFGGEPV